MPQINSGWFLLCKEAKMFSGMMTIAQALLFERDADLYKYDNFFVSNHYVCSKWYKNSEFSNLCPCYIGITFDWNYRKYLAGKIFYIERKSFQVLLTFYPFIKAPQRDSEASLSCKRDRSEISFVVFFSSQFRESDNKRMDLRRFDGDKNSMATFENFTEGLFRKKVTSAAGFLMSCLRSFWT